MSARIGLVTVLFNSATVLPGFFESLHKQDYHDYWLFILDNSLDDLSYNKAQELIAQYDVRNVTLIKNTDNVGIAAGNNQGIKLSLEMGCEYVLLLNNDIEFTDATLLRSMLDVAVTKNEKLIVPKIYYFGGRRIWCAGGEIMQYKGSTRHIGQDENDTGQYDVDTHTNYAPTCFMLVHRSVFEAVGLMDERYFVYFDDTDFVWRSNQNKFRIYYWAKGEVWHKVSTSTGGDFSPFTVYYLTRNRIYFVRKNFSYFWQLISLSYFFMSMLRERRPLAKKLRPRLFAGIVDGFKM